MPFSLYKVLNKKLLSLKPPQTVLVVENSPLVSFSLLEGVAELFDDPLASSPPPPKHEAKLKENINKKKKLFIFTRFSPELKRLL